MALKLAVLVSGSGSNLQAILEAVARGALEADVRLVLANKAEAYGLTRARERGIPTVFLDHGQHPSREAYDAAMVEAIRQAGADTVAMAGFMRMVTPVFLGAFPSRVVNIHPALLPSFPGVHGQRDAAAYGVRFSGCTVHFVDEAMDSGPIIIQAVVPAYAADDEASLGARILALEHRIYPQALQWLDQERLTVAGRKVLLAPGDRPRAPLPAEALVQPPLEEGF